MCIFVILANFFSKSHHRERLASKIYRTSQTLPNRAFYLCFWAIQAVSTLPWYDELGATDRIFYYIRFEYPFITSYYIPVNH